MRKIVALIFISIVAALLNIFFGSVHISFSEVLDVLSGNSNVNEANKFIILQSRIPASITAYLCGAALGVCGLLLQSYFRNPLAGPSILGITSGANLAVALSVLCLGFISPYSITISALIGSMLILAILLLFGRVVRDSVTLLIIGILISFLASALITLINYYTSADGAYSLIIWGMGNFNGVGTDNMVIFLSLIMIGLILAIFLIKPLNGWMLGELYAINLGININRTRILTLVATGILASVTTAFCGPISFIGLSIPHLARMLTHTDNHRSLIPASALFGAICTSLCLFISTLPEGGRLLPINALTPIFGIPIIIYILLRKNH